MWSYAGDPRGIVADLMSAIAEQTNDDGTLPESLCAAASSVIGAAMMYEVYLRADVEAPNPAEHDITQLFAASQAIRHAAYDHGDSLALAIIGNPEDPNTLTESVEALEEWVLSNLAASFAEVIELAEYASEFDAWELAASTPDDNDAA
jgi:hypothetical protein